MSDRSVFADKTEKHLLKALEDAHEALELAYVLASSTAMINDISNIQSSIYNLKRKYPNELPK